MLNGGRRRRDKVGFAAPGAYKPVMTKLFEDAVEAARNLPADAQDTIARVVHAACRE